MSVKTAQRPQPTDGSAVAKAIEEAADPQEKIRLALQFFANPDSYIEVAIGWGESYQPVRDDGLRIARLASNQSYR